MKSVKFIFLIWIILLIVIFSYGLSYHFRGDINKNKYKSKLIQDIYNLYIKQNSKILFNKKENKWKFLMFAHIYCPCTKASIVEFDKLSRKYNFEPLIVFDYISEKEISENNFVNEFQSNKHLAENLKINYIIDYQSKIIKQHKITTSGFTVLYDNLHNVIYTGGVTPYRGHVGESDLHRYLTKLEKNYYLKVNKKRPDNNYLIQTSIINFENLFAIKKLDKKYKTYNSLTYGCSF